MNSDGIRRSLDALKSYYAENPQRAVAPDRRYMQASMEQPPDPSME